MTVFWVMMRNRNNSRSLLASSYLAATALAFLTLAPLACAHATTPGEQLSAAFDACAKSVSENKGGYMPVSEIVPFSSCMLDAERKFGPQVHGNDEVYFEVAATHMLAKAKQVQRGEISLEDYKKDDAHTGETLQAMLIKERARERDRSVTFLLPQQQQDVTTTPTYGCEVSLAGCAQAKSAPSQYPHYDYQPTQIPEAQPSAPIAPIKPLHLQPSSHETWPAAPRMPQTYTINRWPNMETMTGPQGEVARCQNWQNSIQCTGN